MNRLIDIFSVFCAELHLSHENTGILGKRWFECLLHELQQQQQNSPGTVLPFVLTTRPRVVADPFALISVHPGPEDQ